MHIVFTEWHLFVEKCLPWKVLLILGIWTYNFQSWRIPNCFNSVLLIFQGCWENRCYMFGKLRAENSQNVVRHFLDVWHLHTATTQCLKSLLYSVMTLFVQFKAKGQKMMANNNKTTNSLVEVSSLFFLEIFFVISCKCTLYRSLLEKKCHLFFKENDKLYIIKAKK